MALEFELREDVIYGQISIVRKIIRLPRLDGQERFYLAELLKMLYILKNELAKPDPKMNNTSSLTLAELLEVSSYP